MPASLSGGEGLVEARKTAKKLEVETRKEWMNQ